MKKGLKKCIAMVLTAAMALSVGMPAFAENNESLSDEALTLEQKLSILEEYNDKYNVNIYLDNDASDRNSISQNSFATREICEEEFRLHAELLAVKANIAKPQTDTAKAELDRKYHSIIKELDEKYPINSTDTSSENDIDFLTETEPSDVNNISSVNATKTVSKNAAIVRITSTLDYVTSPVARFVSAYNISWKVRSDYADVYSDLY